MTFDLEKIMESKRALRCRMAAVPIAEKLQMLDALRERALSVRVTDSGNSQPAPYQVATPDTPDRPK